jgi:hypothetical protein
VNIRNWLDRLVKPSTPEPRLSAAWRLRDSLAALALFAATAAVVLWQNAHVAVLWDVSYVLDTAMRFAQGQMPYRDFALVHPPLTFLIHAAIIRLTGQIYFHHALYCAIAGGLGSLLAWRMVLGSLRTRTAHAWPLALGLAAPLTVLGLYCIFPFPSYDCDTLLTVLLALWLLQRLTPTSSLTASALTGAAFVLPLLAKQNIGVPLLAVVLFSVLLLLAAARWMPGSVSVQPRQLLALLAGSVTALAVATAVLAATAGLSNYLHWTIVFAGQRRMPGLMPMLGVYACPFVYWALPCTLAGLLLLRGPVAARTWAQTGWGCRAALALLAAPWLFTLASLWVYDDADERGDALLALWPLLLLLAILLVAFRLIAALRKTHPADLRLLVLVAALTAIHGTLMSQQLWGSTYALWPLFIYLAAELLAELSPSIHPVIGYPSGAPAIPAPFAEMAGKPLSESSCRINEPQLPGWFTPSLAATAVVTLLVCGSFYTTSENRLSYADLDGGTPATSDQPALAGLSTPGSYLANFDELVAFTSAAIPPNDAILLLPGEDPFYFATGRKVVFPVLLFDPSTDPLSPEQTLDQVHKQHVHWLVVKRELQIKEDPTPNRDRTLQLLTREFFPVAHLRGYDVYHYAGTHPH